MKKLKSIRILTLLLVFILGINNVNAKINVGDKISIDNVGDDYNNGYHTLFYYGKVVNGEEKGKYAKLYCVDPGLHDVYGPKTVTKVSDFSDNSITNAKYYGLATIIKNGKVNYAGYTKTPSFINRGSADAKEIQATDIAVRAYAFFVLGDSASSNPVLNFKYNYYTMGNKYYGDAVTPQLMKVAYNIASEYSSDLSTYLGIDVGKGKNNTILGVDSNMLNRANTLLRQGFEAAINFRKQNNNSEVSVNVTTTDNNTDNRNVQEKIINFKINQADVQNPGFVKIKRSDIACNNCAEYGITLAKVEYLENNQWKELTEAGIDLAKLVDNGGIAKIKLTINKSIIDIDDIANCKHSIVINYTLPGKLDTSMQLAIMENTGGQRYVGGLILGGLNDNTSGNNNNTQEIEVTRSYTVPSTEIACLPIPCDTVLEVPVCSPDNEGVATITAPTNIKRCIINNNDDANNSYKLSSTNKGIDNNYCSTYCKEDYRGLSLNRALSGLKCGGYFKLKAKVEGSQDCYRGTSTGDKSINQTQFVNDIVEAQKELIAQYNEYQEALQMQKQINSNPQATSVSGTYDKVDVASVSNDGTVSTKIVQGTFSLSNSSASALKEQINSKLENAKKNLDTQNYNDNTSYGKYMSIIKSYNACTTSWDNTFKFSQKIGWEYKEYIDDKLQETYDKLLSNDQKYLTPVANTLVTNTKTLACIGTTDNEYNLCNGSTNNWQAVNSVFSNRTFKVCTINGCIDDVKAISNATFVKQHIDATQEYTTPSVFYQIASSGPLSGGITTNGSYTGPNASLTPVDGLPLSLDSVGGGVFKMHIEDLGEFYDTGELGRLIDFKGNHETSSVAYKVGYGTAWSGEYECYYKSNCTPTPGETPCPQCDFYCEGDYCEWRECPECDIECVNCIYNLGELQLSMKSVSTTNFSSVEREYGYNWNINTLTGTIANQLELIQDKAKETIKEIEESNTTIYDESNVGSEESKLEFSIKLSSDMANHIKDYNINNEKVGGYNNQTLTCYDYEDQDGVIYKNIFCYSSFIDDLIENYGDDVYAKNRDAIAGRSQESVSHSEYWETWEKEHKKITSYNEQAIGGPSWK